MDVYGKTNRINGWVHRGKIVVLMLSGLLLLSCLSGNYTLHQNWASFGSCLKNQYCLRKQYWISGGQVGICTTTVMTILDGQHLWMNISIFSINDFNRGSGRILS